MNCVLLNTLEEVRILGIFKGLYESYSPIDKKKRLRNILALSSDNFFTIHEIVRREQKIELNQNELERLNDLIIAFLNKTSYRTYLPEEDKIKLLSIQDNKCAICGCDISLNHQADHIVPFKYVGDSLKNNWQMLCPHCNEKKKDSLDYQLRILLKVI